MATCVISYEPAKINVDIRISGNAAICLVILSIGLSGDLYVARGTSQVEDHGGVNGATHWVNKNNFETVISKLKL